MESIIRNVILSGRYELSDILKKIDTIWVQGDITDEEKTELCTLAQEKANPENSYAPLQNQLNEVFAQIADLKATVEANSQEMSALKDAVEKLGQPVVVPEPEPAEEYPDWYAWDGIGNIPWQQGSKCTHNNSKWESQVANNIWEPGAVGVYETIWKQVD